MRELVKITLGGAEHNLRPTWEAYGEIEARCGPLNGLWQSVGYGTATLAQMAAIVTIGLRAAGSLDGRKIDEATVSQRLYEAGPWSNEVRVPITEYLESLGWTPDQRKKLQAEADRIAGNPSASSPASSSSPPASTG